ncbi:MAG: hypothetical protein ETSY1_35795, partial [Candidatus Entotheonella factor]
MSVTAKRFHTGSHWGLFDAEVEEGVLVGIQPFAGDPHPTPLVHAMPSAVYHRSRITWPMVRKGYLEQGIESDRAGRGVEPFVPVSWDEALDLVAAELQRVKSEHGNEALYASSGWASAGVFHNAKSQLFRFMNGLGGFIDQVTNYSNGAASVIVPHVVGDLASLNGPLTAWPTIRDHTQLMVLFGGMAPKNAQLSNGGMGPHSDADWVSEVRRAGVEFVNISPVRDDAAQMLDAEWWPICPNTDTALMLALAHTLVSENLHDTDF